jgi:coenzyme PQQ precursor peptide PqqA
VGNLPTRTFLLRRTIAMRSQVLGRHNWRLPEQETRLTLRTSDWAPRAFRFVKSDSEDTTMAWTTPTLVEICIGLEINGYLPAEF